MTAALAVGMISLAVMTWPPSARPARRGQHVGAAQSAVAARLAGMRSRGVTRRDRATISVIAAIGLALVIPIHAAVCGAIVVYVCVAAAEHARQRKSALATDARTSDLLHALAAELRAGHDLASACRSVAASDGTSLGRALVSAGQAIRLGEHPADALLRATGTRAGVELAALVRLSGSHGIPLADAVEVLANDNADRARERRNLAGLLAGPRATASLLAALPVFGILMGESIGAHPLRTLLHTGAGAFIMVAGVLLAAAGMFWTQALVRRVES